MQRIDIDRGMRVPFGLEPLMDALAEALAARLEPRLSPAGAIQPRLLTVRQAAKFLGCSESSIYHQIKDGKLAVVRRDRRVFLDVKDLDRMIDECKQRIS